MKSPFVRDLEPNKVVTGNFLVNTKEVRQKKTGEPYLSLLLCDRTGEIDAKMWDNVGEVLETFDRDDFIRVKGLIQIFHNRPQLTVHKLRRLDESELDFSDFFPASERSPDEMWTELRQTLAEIRNPHLLGLVNALLDDPEVGRRFRMAPAAKHIHHAFLGGLLEHVLSLCHMARMVAGHYKELDCDLLLTGVVVHDIGKIYELSYDRGFGYTSDGQLLGHMMIALRMIGDKLRDLPDFPPRLRTLVEHMVISHHGQLDFGSTKVPQFAEAMALHYIDDLDSKLECMRSLVRNDRQVDGCFTVYSPSLERVVLKKSKYLEERPASDAPSPEQPAAVAPAPAAASQPATAAPPAVPQPAAPRPPLAAATPKNSVFGDKLLQALTNGKTDEESR